MTGTRRDGEIKTGPEGEGISPGGTVVPEEQEKLGVTVTVSNSILCFDSDSCVPK
jgi:hypothetical protein